MKRLLLMFVTLMSLTGCLSTHTTPDYPLRSSGQPVPAKLGVMLPGDRLEKLFTSGEENLLAQISGQLFSSAILLPPDSRYSAPQDLHEQYGIDLLVNLEISDIKSFSALNVNMILAAPTTWFTPLFPIATLGQNVTLESDLRDARTGKLISSQKETTSVQDTASVPRFDAIFEELAQRGIRNATALTFERLSKQLASYSPATSVQPLKLSNKQPNESATKNGNRYAVIFGVEKYRERLPNADFAVNDAKSIAELLVTNGGYKEENIILRTNEQATKSDMDKYINAWLRNNVDSSSSILFYFSGHGTPKTTNGEGYLVPYDGDPTFVEQTGLSLKSLYATLESLPAKEIVVLLDACFTGAGNRSVLPAGAKPLVMNAQQQVTAHGRKTVVLASTSGSNISLSYKEKKHGLFTHFVLQGLSGEAAMNEDGSVNVQELFTYLKPQVQRIARKEYNAEQSPQLMVPNELMTKAPLKIVGGL